MVLVFCATSTHTLTCLFPDNIGKRHRAKSTAAETLDVNNYTSYYTGEKGIVFYKIDINLVVFDCYSKSGVIIDPKWLTNTFTHTFFRAL